MVPGGPDAMRNRRAVHTARVEPPAPDVPPAVPPAPRRGGATIGRWPFGIVAVVVLRTIDAAAFFAVAFAVRGLPLGELPLLAANPEVTRAAGLVFGLLTMLGIAGLVMFKRWGWVLTMVLVGVSLLLDLVRVAIDEPRYLALLLHVVTAFYLNGRAVRALAGVTHADEEHDHEAVPSPDIVRPAP